MRERAPARKVRILDLMVGQWNKNDNETGYILTKYGEKVSRVWILATVVGKFLSEDGRFSSITIDDGTDTMRAKAWQNLELISNIQKGELVDIIGRVREYGGEVYIQPEIVRRVDNPDLQSMRRLEILAKMKGFKPETDPKEALKQAVLVAIGDGISYTELLAKLGKSEMEIEPAINDLLAEGLCYEPSPGKIKKI